MKEHWSRDQLAVGVHRRRLVPVEAPALALVVVAHLGMVHRHDAVLAHSAFQAHLGVSIITGVVVSTDALHVLEQQLSQQLRPVNYGLPLGAVHGQPCLSLSYQL